MKTPKPKLRLKRNDVPRPMVYPVEFNTTLSLDRTKITEQEYAVLIGKAEIDAREAWLLSQATKDPTGPYIKYFTIIE